MVGIEEEAVAIYSPGFLKLFKWVMIAISARKAYITRTKALCKRDKENRVLRETQAEERAKNRETYLAEAADKFNEEHKEDIIAYQEYMAKQTKKDGEEYGDERGSDVEEEDEKEPPVNPVFNEKDAEEAFDSENPEIEIPDEAEDQVNNDWVLTEEEEARLIEEYLGSKPAE